MRRCSGVRGCSMMSTDSFVGQRAGLVEAERLEIARDHFHRGDAARFHRRHEIGPVFEGGPSASPEAEALGVGEAGDRGGARGRDIQDAGIRQCVLQAQSGAALG